MGAGGCSGLARLWEDIFVTFFGRIEGRGAEREKYVANLSGAAPWAQAAGEAESKSGLSHRNLSGARDARPAARGRHRRRLLGAARQDGPRERSRAPRHHGGVLRRAPAHCAEERALRQRLGTRIQRRPAKRRLQNHQPQCRRPLLLRREFFRLTESAKNCSRCAPKKRRTPASSPANNRDEVTGLSSRRHEPNYPLLAALLPPFGFTSTVVTISRSISVKLSSP